jgi:hypothetical protein
MDPTLRPAAPSDLPAADGGSGSTSSPQAGELAAAAAPSTGPASSPQASSPQAGPGPVNMPPDGGPGSGVLAYAQRARSFPVPRHRRPNDAQLAGGGPLATARFIRFTIVFTILFVLAMTGLIWYRWYPVVLPTSCIEFTGDESLEGAVATVSQNGRESYSVTLDQQNGYTATVWLSPGRYNVVVRGKNRAVIQRGGIEIEPMESRVDPLSAKPASAAAPAAEPATHPVTAP